MAKDMEELLNAELEAAKAKKKPPLTQPEINALNAQANVAQAVNPIAALLGLTGNQDISKTSTTSSVPAAIDPNEFRKAEDTVRQMPLLQRELAMRQSSLEGLDPTAMLGAPQRDLSSLMALADAWSKGKSNMLGAYQRPTSVADRTKLIAGIQKMIKDETEGMSDAEKEFLKLALSGKKVTTVEDTQKTGEGKAKKEHSQALNQLITKWDVETKDLQKSINQGRTFVAELSKPSWLSDAASAQRLAKQIQGGQISNMDVAQLRAPPALMDKFVNTLSRVASGESSDKVRKDFLTYAKNVLDYNLKELKAQAEDQAQNRAPAFGVAPDTFLGAVGYKRVAKDLEEAGKEEAEKADYQKRMRALEEQLKGME